MELYLSVKYGTIIQNSIFRRISIPIRVDETMGKGFTLMKKRIFLVISILFVSLTIIASSQLAGKVKVIALGLGYDYFVVETLYSSPTHYALIELYDGNFPSLGEILIGEFRQSDREIINLNDKSSLWIGIIFISQSRMEAINRLKQRVPEESLRILE